MKNYSEENQQKENQLERLNKYCYRRSYPINSQPERTYFISPNDVLDLLEINYHDVDLAINDLFHRKVIKTAFSIIHITG